MHVLRGEAANKIDFVVVRFILCCLHLGRIRFCALILDFDEK